MPEFVNYTLIIELLIIALAIFGGVWVGKYLREKNTTTEEDLNLIYVINEVVVESILNDETAKSISRIIGKAIRLIESTMANVPNDVKEQKALELIVEAITDLKLGTPIDEEGLRKIIKLAVAFMEPTLAKNQFTLAKFTNK